MKRILTYTVFLSLCLCCSVDQSYKYPQSPYIDSPAIEFIKGRDSNAADTLVLSFVMFDEEGDLGLDENFDIHPFHDYNIVIDNENTIVTIGALDPPTPFYNFVSNTSDPFIEGVFSETDNRPDYDCQFYELMYINEDRNTYIPSNVNPEKVDLEEFHLDTVYVNRNENRFNLFLEWYQKEGDNEEPILWEYVVSQYGCGISFNSRFPLVQELKHFETLSEPGYPFVIRRNSEYGYDVQYKMISHGFSPVLQNSKFKIKTTIRDYSLNESNNIETEYMSLEEMISAD